MLIKPARKDIDKYIDLAYKLALDQTRSGYPIYTDGIKTRKTFIQNAWRAYRDANREILLFENGGQIQGWIQFFWLEADLYLQTEVFNTTANTQKALAEFAAYAKENFPGYTLYLGFPKCNTEAVVYFTENGWECIEKSYNDVLFFDQYTPRPENDHVIRVTRENYSAFRKLHEQNDAGMYWNANRLHEDLDNWNIYLYCQDTHPLGAIFYRQDEIYGIIHDQGKFRKDIYQALLTRALNDFKSRSVKHIVFFNDEISQAAALELGFTCVGEYILHIKNV